MLDQGSGSRHGREREQWRRAATPGIADGGQPRTGHGAMTRRKLLGFIDALVSGRRPERFSASPDDVDVLRMAIALRAERPGDAKPDDEFVSGLYEELKAEASTRAGLGTPPVRVA